MCACSWLGRSEELEEGQEQQDVLNADHAIAVEVALRAGGASEISEQFQQIFDREFAVAIEVSSVSTCAEGFVGGF